MKPHAAWPWSESLGAVRTDPNQVLRVRRILFGMVRNRCQEVGLEEGTELRYQDRTPEGVALELSGIGRRTLEFPYAWFVQVELVGPTGPPESR
jgi:hypothetical protein